MEVRFEVKRSRVSVTQGSAAVLVNGVEVIRFGDKMERIEDGEKHYGENIGGWASKIPDTQFIIGLLFHKMDGCYHYSDKARRALDDILAEEME